LYFANAGLNNKFQSETVMLNITSTPESVNGAFSLINSLKEEVEITTFSISIQNTLKSLETLNKKDTEEEVKTFLRTNENIKNLKEEDTYTEYEIEGIEFIHSYTSKIISENNFSIRKLRNIKRNNTNKTALIVIPFLDKWGNNFEKIVPNLVDFLEIANYKPTFLVNKDVNYQNLKLAINQYDLIYFATHSGNGKLQLREPITNLVDGFVFDKDIALMITADCELCKAIKPSFFTTNKVKDKAIVILNACETMKDEELSNSIILAGALIWLHFMIHRNSKFSI
jgi:CHAT domain-containing protein